MFFQAIIVIPFQHIHEDLTPLSVCQRTINGRSWGVALFF